MKYVFFLLMAASLSATLAFPQDYQVSVTTVNVWIRVVDVSGNPVAGLHQADFEVYEDGKKMNPSCFEEVSLSMPNVEDMDKSISSAQSSADVPKRFILFLDLYNTSQAELQRIRPELDTFLRRIHLRNWEIMMVAYLPSGKLGIVSPFTHSISSLRRLLDQADGNAERDQKITRNENHILEFLAPLEIHRQDAPDEPEQEAGNPTTGASIVGGQYMEQQYFEMAISAAYRQAHVFANEERKASEHAFAGLEAFGEYYGKNLSSGEHTVILFVSGGINSDPGRRYFDLVNSYVSRTAANVDPSQFILSTASTVKENNFDIERQVEESIGKLNRYNLTLYAMNTRGLDPSGPDVTKAEGKYAALNPQLIRDYQDSLSQMAEETGGFSFQNSQNVRFGFDSVLDDISHQYLVCYRSPDHKKSKKYYSIKVVSKKPGLKLRYRQGYVD